MVKKVTRKVESNDNDIIARKKRYIERDIKECIEVLNSTLNYANGIDDLDAITKIKKDIDEIWNTCMVYGCTK